MRLLAIFIIIVGFLFRGFSDRMPDPYDEVGEVFFVICLIAGVAIYIRESKKCAPASAAPSAWRNWAGLALLAATLAGLFLLYYWRMHVK